MSPWLSVSIPRPGTSIYQSKPDIEPHVGHRPSESQALTDLQKGLAEFLHVILQLLQFFVHVDLRLSRMNRPEANHTPHEITHDGGAGMEPWPVQTTQRQRLKRTSPHVQSPSALTFPLT